MIKFKNGSPPESPDDPDAFDITEAAKYLMLAKPTVYRMVAKRKIIHYKRGKRLYFRKNDLDVWINKGRRKTLDEINEEADQYIKRKGRYNNY
jgi:excisionase family DNA binding protein